MRRDARPVVLIVEDEPLVSVFVRDVLEDCGYTTKEAANARDALEMLLHDGFAAVVTDIEMPGDFDGVDLAWAVEAKWPETGVVLTSGRTLPAPDHIPVKARFVTKPVEIESLLLAVKEVIEG